MAGGDIIPASSRFCGFECSRKSMNQCTEQGKKLLILLAALILVEGVFMWSWAGDFSQKSPLGMTSDTLRISDLQGEASLGGPAVMVAEQGGGLEMVSLCQNLPTRVYGFLLLAYVALLLFNFQISYRKRGQVGGVFEVVLTGLFVLIWSSFDECREALWFPWVLVKAGLLLALIAQAIALVYQEHQAEYEEENEEAE